VAVGSNVDVLVAGGGGTGENTAAVNVNWETTVLAADVRTAATSGVGSGVVDDPQAAISNAGIRSDRRSLFFIGSILNGMIIYNRPLWLCLPQNRQRDIRQNSNRGRFATAKSLSISQLHTGP